MRVSNLLIAFGLSHTASAALFSEKKTLNEVAIAHVRQLQSASKAAQGRKLDQMPEFSPEAMCVLGTIGANYTVGTTDTVLEEINDDVCDQSTLTCDFSSYFESVDQECTSQGGKTITGSYTICEELFLMEAGGESPGGDITINGVAFCVSPDSCPADVTVEGYMQGTVEFLEWFIDALSDGEMGEEMDEVVNALKLASGDCSASAGRGIGSLVLASIVGIGALFAIV
ncbi:predicted protein [Chaetoceros tenuissimus]|uniref:Uncharacterized protein n=1 Tax=Chaetoceros tenuissimus TaxID=426638 RepID=A0AAD3CJD3_9STRA|nr:predicted protein [Chaetoceros tenuissimus]